MKRIILFLVVTSLWALSSIFISQDGSKNQAFYINYIIYSIVGIVSAPFLIYFFFKSKTLNQKIYTFCGYLVVIPWVYIGFNYLDFLIHPLLLCILVSVIPVIGSYAGYLIAKNK